MSSFPPSPSSQGTPSADSPLGQPQQLISSSSSSEPSRPSTAANASGNTPTTTTTTINGFVSGESIMTPTIPGATAAGGAVRRKPARRANTAERRATHNAVERQRRETLNGRFLDLAALLPNLATVRRPSKSAIVNSSIALVHTQRRLRAIAGRELRQLVQEADALRREVNEWRAAHPMDPVPAAAMAAASSDHASPAGSSPRSASSPLEPVIEPARSAEFVALLEVDTSAAEDNMNEQERIAYEMRGGDSGPLAASFPEEGDEDYLGGGGAAFGMDDDVPSSSIQQQQQQPIQPQQMQSMQMPMSVQFQTPQQFAAPAPNVVLANAVANVGSNMNATTRARAQSLSVPRHLNQQQQQQQQSQVLQASTTQFNVSTPQQFGQQQQQQLQQQLQLNPQQAAAAASLIPSSYSPHQQQQQQQQQQYALQQQQQQQQLQQQAMQMASLGLGVGNVGGMFPQTFLPPTFDAIAAAAAGFPPTNANVNLGMAGMGYPTPQQQQQHQQQVSEQDAAKLAAWNAHLFSAALAAQQQQRDQQQQQQYGGFQTHTPPSSSHGAQAPFGGVVNRAQSEERNGEDNGNGNNLMDSASVGGASTPGSSSGVPPSLTLSISGLSSSPSLSSNPPLSAGGHASSLPSSLASPLNNLSLASQQQDAFAAAHHAFPFGSAPGAGGNWAAMSKNSPVGTPPISVGGGGMGGYVQYPMMNVFV